MTWRRTAVIAPGVGVSLLPELEVSLCWPASTGVISTVGLGFLVDSRNLLALAAVFLVLAVTALAFRARERRGYGPALMSFAASVAVLIGKFYLESPSIMYAALGVLVAASIWNGWPIRPAAACPRCIDHARQSLQRRNRNDPTT
jgi:hypothetical protein